MGFQRRGKMRTAEKRTIGEDSREEENDSRGGGEDDDRRGQQRTG